MSRIYDFTLDRRLRDKTEGWTKKPLRCEKYLIHGNKLHLLFNLNTKNRINKTFKLKNNKYFLHLLDILQFHKLFFLSSLLTIFYFINKQITLLLTINCEHLDSIPKSLLNEYREKCKTKK